MTAFCVLSDSVLSKEGKGRERTLKARSHSAFFFVNATVIKKGCEILSMILFILCDCDYLTFTCVWMSHMNGLHTHSVQLQCAIHTKIYVNTNRSPYSVLGFKCH